MAWPGLQEDVRSICHMEKKGPLKSKHAIFAAFEQCQLINSHRTSQNPAHPLSVDRQGQRLAGTDRARGLQNVARELQRRLEEECAKAGPMEPMGSKCVKPMSIVTSASLVTSALLVETRS